MLRLRGPPLPNIRRQNDALPGNVYVRHGDAARGVPWSALLQRRDEERTSLRQYDRVLLALRRGSRVWSRRSHGEEQGDIRESVSCFSNVDGCNTHPNISAPITVSLASIKYTIMRWRPTVRTTLE